MAEIKEVQRSANKGEYIKIVNEHASEGCYKNGDIHQVTHCYSFFNGDVLIESGIPMFPEDGTTHAYVDASEYVVLEGYEPPVIESEVQS